MLHPSLKALPPRRPYGETEDGPHRPGLEIERALTESQRRKLLDAADHLPVPGGRSRDRRRCKDVEFADEPEKEGVPPLA